MLLHMQEVGIPILGIPPPPFLTAVKATIEGRSPDSPEQIFGELLWEKEMAKFRHTYLLAHVEPLVCLRKILECHPLFRRAFEVTHLFER